MAIQAPKWAKGSHPTLRGWVKDGELLKSQNITQDEINEWNGETSAPKVVATSAPKAAPVQLREIAPTTTLIDDMSKKELESFARTKGVELDRRESKRSLIAKVKNLMG
tara:strand:- start:4952 stop:5278 length:327 start_codon:yes stop_codon:yes gene_type:complete